MVVLDHFPLLFAIVFGYHRLAAQKDPLEEAVELLALVCCGLNRCPQFLIRKVAEQKGRPDYTIKFAECQIEPVLTAVGAKSAQDVGSSNTAGFDRKRHTKHIRQMVRMRSQSTLSVNNVSICSKRLLLSGRYSVKSFQCRIRGIS